MLMAVGNSPLTKLTLSAIAKNVRDWEREHPFGYRDLIGNQIVCTHAYHRWFTYFIVPKGGSVAHTKAWKRHRRRMRYLDKVDK